LSVSLLRDGARVGQARTVRLERRQTRRVRVLDRVDEERVVRYRALLRAPLGDPANDTREAVARVGDRPLILAVGAPVPGDAGFLVEALRPAEVGAYLDDARVRARVDALLVRGDLPARAQERVAAAVREGAGLVLLGGTEFEGERLARVLPLTSTPPEGRAALLLLDFSGSMQARKAELLDAVERLKEHFAPADRVSFLAFRDVAVQRVAWTTVEDARWDLRPLRPHGNTLLKPALQEAERMLHEVRGARRRVLVVSDGEWGDLYDPELRRRIAVLESAGIRVAALFVQKEVDPAARELFPVSLQAGADDLGATLLRLEDGAEDRTVREARAVLGDVPAWLAGAVPSPGLYRGFPRLYPRDAGEKIALRDGPIPLVGAWRRVGKVVVAAPTDGRVDVAALLRACLREARGIRLSARREAAGLLVEARGGAGAPFVIDGVEAAARPAGPDRWRVHVARVGAGAVQVACGDALLLVPPAAARELAGVTNCPKIAGDIARRTGGRLYEGAPPAAPAPLAPAVYVTLLAAALLVLASAWWRRRT
jgi:Mg-chelatase subunit ChlD